MANMSKRHGTDEVQSFTLDELRHDQARVIDAAKGDRGAIVVDENGQRRFTIWFPQGPIQDD
jgi:hypothetical protein